MRSVGETDRFKLDQYADAVRSVERRIQVSEEQSSRELPKMEKPIGIPEKFSDYTKLLLDLQVLAFQGDITRVSTFVFGHEMTGRAYPELGFGDPHHSLTHHQGDAAKIAKVLQINIFHASLFRYFLEKMRSVPDGDGTLLDHSLIVYGSPLSDGNMHMYKDLPVVLVAGGVAGIRGDGEMAGLLIRAGAKVNARNDYGASPLYAACATGNIATIKMLLEAKADPNVPLVSGETPLMAAVDQGNLDAVRLLLDYKADTNAQESKGGQTALMWAAAGRHPQLLKLLVEHGADVRARSKGDFTAL